MNANPFSALNGLGPRSGQMLTDAGITSIKQLQQLGAVSAFAQVRQTHPNVSLNLLWALEGALTRQHWQQIARHERERLLLMLEQHESGAPD